VERVARCLHDEKPCRCCLIYVLVVKLSLHEILTEERVTAFDPEDVMVKYVCVRFCDGGGVEEHRRGLLLVEH
jgi:hypothetical protein